MTLISNLTFSELRVVSMEHLRRVLHANRERLLFQTPGPVPFRTCMCSTCWDQSFSRTYRNFGWLCSLNIFRYFLHFAYLHINITIRKYYHSDSIKVIKRKMSLCTWFTSIYNIHLKIKLSLKFYEGDNFFIVIHMPSISFSCIFFL